MWWDQITSPGGLALLGAVGTAGIAVGKGAQWLLRYIDRKTEDHIKAEQEAREALQRSLERRIDDLQRQVRDLMSRETLYIRRIYQLESVMASNGVSIPHLDGWPP